MRRDRVRRLRGRAVALAAALTAVSACSDGPSGPGTLDGSVTGPTPLGAVVVEVTGQGITGFVGRGDTRAYGSVVSATEGRHRVVLVDVGGGTLDFGVKVDDLGAAEPSVGVLFAAGVDNQTLGTAGIEVKLGG